MPSAQTVFRYGETLILSVNALYGAFLVLYVLSSMLLLQRRRQLQREGMTSDADVDRLRTMRFWEVMGLLMFLVLTVSWSLMWAQTIGQPSDALASRIIFGRLLMSEFNIFIGDLIVIHRLWIVGNRNKLLVAPPLLALLVFIIFCVPFSWEYFIFYWGKPIFGGKLFETNWIMGLVAATLSINLYCTIALASRIWFTNRRVQHHGGGGGALMNLVAILVESVAVYSLWMVAVIILLARDVSLYITFFDIASQIYGVSTMLISVRVGLGWSTGTGWTMPSKNSAR